MSGVPPIIISIFTGFASGLLLSIPVGPVNLTIMNEGAQRGFRQAAVISSGALLMEVIYCSLAFTGFASFFTAGKIHAAMEVFTFLFMLGLGIKYLVVKSIQPLSARGSRIEEKLHPTSAFMTGFVRVLANFGVFLFWIFLAVQFISHGWVEPTWASKGVCVLGVLVGTGLWFYGLSYAVSLGHRKFSDRTLLRMERGSGIGLLLLAVAHGAEMIWKLHEQHHL